ncbi:hypothetical protein ACRQ1B_06550 [Rhizobium panacihumi]|uniref:hypothetical protein n=1 Tax=Rhizobium panacihumi TaxID=2008450 RepID=UPI003D79D547
MAVLDAGGVAGADVVPVGAFEVGMNIHTASAMTTTTTIPTMTFLFIGSSSKTVLVGGNHKEVVRHF